jgi:DNA-binding MarR family transcriptional regulator
MASPRGAEDDAPQDQRPSPLNYGPLAGIVGFHLARATVTTYAAYEQSVGKPFALKKAEFSLLMLVMANAATPAKRLAHALAVTAPQLTLMLDKLEERALLKRARNPLDGRSQHVVLTAKGAKLARDSAAAALVMERQLQQRLSAAEHAMLIELLDKLARRHAP